MDKTATQIVMERCQVEARLRALAAAAAQKVAQRNGKIDPSANMTDLTFAAYCALEMVYNDDAEVRFLAMERDHYKKLALEALARAPIPVFMAAKDMLTHPLNSTHQEQP